jgi:hypothetical protein
MFDPRNYRMLDFVINLSKFNYQFLYRGLYMGDLRQHFQNTGLHSRINLQSIGYVFITLLLITLFSSIAVAGDNNSSNAIDYNLTFNKYSDNPRYVSPQPMEFGTNVKESSLVKINASKEQTRKHVYIQFYERWQTEEQNEILENYGIEIVGRAGGYATKIASMSASLTPADIPAETGLRWMGEIPPEDKWSSGSPEVPDRARIEAGMIYIGVRMYEDVSINDSRNLRDRYAISSSQYSKYIRSDDRYLIYEFITEENNLTSILDEDIVENIWFLPPPPTVSSTEPDVQFPVTNTSSASATAESQSVPGFRLISSLAAFMLLFYMRSRR